ncbi:MAG: Wzz/FepE/Etk N-terminal domain-containing protein [Gammaproteobacteria bacterium]
MEPGKTNLPEAENIRLPATQPPGAMPVLWSGGYSLAGEIDLVDLGVMLWRRWRLMLAVFIVVVALTMVAAFLKKPEHNYITSIQLGSMIAQDGTLVPLLPPESAAAMLQNTYVPNAIYQYQSEHNLDLRDLKIAVVSAGSVAVTLSCKVSDNLRVACMAVEMSAAGNFVRDNVRATATLRANLTAQADTAKLNLIALQDPIVFGAQKLTVEKAIADARNTLANLQGTAAVLKVRNNKLNASMDLYQKEAVQLQVHISEVRKVAIDAAKSAASPTEAMANLLLSTEVQRSVDLYSQIQHKLVVDLPEQLATVNKNLEENVRGQALQKQVIAQKQSALQKLLFTHGQDIQNQQIVVSDLQSRLSNIQDNRVLSDPVRSITRVSLGRSAIVALGVVIGFSSPCLPCCSPTMCGKCVHVWRLSNQQDHNHVIQIQKSWFRGGAAEWTAGYAVCAG